MTNTADHRPSLHPYYKLGKMPAFARPQALMFAAFVKPDAPPPPETYDFWLARAPFTLETYGNDQYSDCTVASKAQFARRLERLEIRQTPQFLTAEIVRVYRDMTTRLYGGGDTGAYEEDALAEWRKPDLTFRDTRGHPHTIDAFTRLDSKNLIDLKRAISLSGSKGIKICFNLPKIWSTTTGMQPWDIQRGADGTVTMTGDAMPGSWGGHSMYANRYDKAGIWVVHTWGLPDQLVTWAAVSAYSDEAHSIVDSVDVWRKRPTITDSINLPALISAVNDVSSQKIVA